MNDATAPISTRRAPGGLPWAVAVGVTVAVAAYAVCFAAVPSVRERLVVEDGIIETTTALVFLGAALLGFAGMVRRRHRRLFWLVPAFGLFGFLDEMSFGARIFGFPLPVVDGIEVDSFHDVFDLGDRFTGDLGISRTQIAAAAAVLAVGFGAWLWRTGRLRTIPGFLRDHPPIALLLAAFCLLLAGVGLDLLGTGTTARFAEETAEFAAAGLVLVAAARLTEPPPAPSPAAARRLEALAADTTAP